MKKFAGFVVLFAVLSVVPSAFNTSTPVLLNDVQMAQVSGAGNGCDLVGGVAIGLGIGGAFGCVPCGGAAAVIGAGYWIWC